MGGVFIVCRTYRYGDRPIEMDSAWADLITARQRAVAIEDSFTVFERLETLISVEHVPWGDD